MTVKIIHILRDELMSEQGLSNPSSDIMEQFKMHV
jgi:hypothetical protein